MRRGRITAILLGLVLLLSACQSGGPGTVQIASDGNNDTEFHISDITPATDYFGYINAETLMGLELEPGRNSAGVTIDMMNTTSDRIDGLIDEIVTSNKDYPKGSNEQMIRDVYNLLISFYEGDEEKDKSDEAIIDSLIERTDRKSVV